MQYQSRLIILRAADEILPILYLDGYGYRIVPNKFICRSLKSQLKISLFDSHNHVLQNIQSCMS